MRGFVILSLLTPNIHAAYILHISLNETNCKTKIRPTNLKLNTNTVENSWVVTLCKIEVRYVYKFVIFWFYRIFKVLIQYFSFLF